MVGWLGKSRYGPIGVDVGSRSVKLLQFNADRSRVCDAVRWDLPGDKPDRNDDSVAEAIQRAREGHNFHGRQAVFCLGAGDLFVQNIRVPQASGPELHKVVWAEAAGRLPFAREEAEVRFVEAADVRQGDSVRREVILLACRHQVVDRIVALAERVGLTPAAIDAEPNALLRCYAKQFRRGQDQEQRQAFVDVGGSLTTVVIGHGSSAMFIKYLDVGGNHMDEAVARQLKMRMPEAAALRRHNGDRRADQRDPEIARGVAESIRPVLDRLANELSLCLRYYSVTFRGQPLARVVLGGGESSQALVDWLAPKLDTPCELGNPLRSYETPSLPGRQGQWGVAAGLALREVNG